MITLYKPDGTALLGYDINLNAVPLVIDDDSYRQATIMGDDLLMVYFTVPSVITIPRRTYTDFEGKRYYLYQDPEIVKNSSGNYKYTMPLYTAAYSLSLVLARNTVDYRLKFPLTATAREHLDTLVANLNTNNTTANLVWAINYAKTIGMEQDNDGSHIAYDGTRYNDNGDEKLVSYDFSYCLDAIKNIAAAYSTEYEVEEVLYNGKRYMLLSVHDIEYNLDDPLSMRYGKGNGFVSGEARKNRDTTPPLDILYIQGGEHNIPAHYGQTIIDNLDGTTTYEGTASTTLLLPRNAAVFFDGTNFYFSKDPTVRYTTNNVPYILAKEDSPYENLYNDKGFAIDEPIATPIACYLTDSRGMSLRRVRHTYYDPSYTPRSTNVEGFYNATEIYPMYVGTVDGVLVTPAQTEPDDEGNRQWYYLYDIYDTTAPDYSQCSIAGQTMNIVFQDGMLAGRELELHTTDDGTVICPEEMVTLADGSATFARRLELCPSDTDGITLPGGVFVPRVGDHYAVFHCNLPDDYITNIRYGAEWRAARECVAYLHENTKDRYTFQGSVDTLWAKEYWDLIKDYMALGEHIRVMDTDIFGSEGLVMRVTAIKQYLYNPKAPELTLDNALAHPIDFSTALRRNITLDIDTPVCISPQALNELTTGATAISSSSLPTINGEARRLNVASQENLDNVKDEVNALDDSVQQLDSDFQNVQSDVQTMQNDVQTMQNDVQTMQTDLANTQGDLALTQTSLSALSSEVTDAHGIDQSTGQQMYASLGDRLDEIEGSIATTTPQEVIDARGTDPDGQEYNTLGERLDASDSTLAIVLQWIQEHDPDFDPQSGIS